MMMMASLNSSCFTSLHLNERERSFGCEGVDRQSMFGVRKLCWWDKLCTEQRIPLSKQYAMRGGTGESSYAQNSSFQGMGVEIAEELLKEQIVEKLDVKQICSGSSLSFSIADFGCAAGPNTFLAVKAIIDSLELKLKSEGLQEAEYQVFFNDTASNDFNTLINSLPLGRQYYAAAVPGSFHDIVLPKGSIHCGYSSFAANWLSKAPKSVSEKGSLAWNEGLIHYPYTAEKRETIQAYSAQFGEDIESFLQARAHEFVGGGVMALVFTGVPDGAIFSQTTIGREFQLLGFCFSDMAKMGLISNEAVDSFNLPLYFPYMKELEAVIKKNGQFSIEKKEKLSIPTDGVVTEAYIRGSALRLRSALEEVITKHFGSEIIDELFSRLDKKVKECAALFSGPDAIPTTMLVLILKRN
ncbi:hypothetical protein L6164_001640 [Bauhinia variegata]|uniref:Uncharacterized protein n=1 Tax=Bauhinia variegata TaxID=167791 RepID=A0ACB9QCH8_BAUVA|nr:hypothetical protein L6164_001640 [Bauhinia variegata]